MASNFGSGTRRHHDGGDDFRFQIDVDHRGCTLAFPRGHVCENGIRVFKHAAILVNMPKEVQPRFDLFHAPSEIFTAVSPGHGTTISKPLRRPVGDEHICALGNLRPLVRQRFAPR